MGRKVFALLVTAGLLYITSPLLLPVIMGGVLAVLFMPWLEKLERLRLSTMLGAALVTVGVTLTILIPTALLGFFGAKSGLSQLHAMHEAPDKGEGDLIDQLIGSPTAQKILDWITDWFPVRMNELIDSAHEFIRSVVSRLGELLGALFTHVPGMAMYLAVIIVSLYFLLVDGRKLLILFRRNTIFGEQQTDNLVHHIASMCRSVILASLVSGGAQAGVELVACLITRNANVALITMLVFMGSFVPVVGSAPVTIFVAVQAFVTGNTSAGIILAIAVALVVGVDNFIRPWFLKGSANLHPLLAFISAFGGLQTIGFLGVFLGPIVAGIFVATVQILFERQD